MLNPIRIFKCLYKNNLIYAGDYVQVICFQGSLPLKDASPECTALHAFALFCNLEQFSSVRYARGFLK